MTEYKITKYSAVKSLNRRHPWIFSGALEDLKAEVGELVRLIDINNRFLGIGYCNPDNIKIRILTFKDEVINQEFWNKRFEEAFSLRKELLNFQETNCFRLINAEGDFLPGLIVDVYDKYAVIDFHTKGIEVFQNEIKLAIENLDLKPILMGEPVSETEVIENGIKYVVSPGLGQKTGLFLDQRENRLRIRDYVKGKNVLNMFSYSGGFSLNALTAGASNVVNVDSSEIAINQAKENYKLNGFEVKDENFIIEDGFDYLEKAKENGLHFDIVILDPPAFAKHKDAIKRALAGYRRLNTLGMNIISSNGNLITFSCSGHISNADFRSVVWQASMDAGCEIQILQNPLNQFDHLLNMNLPEGEYLKGLFLKMKK